MSKARQARHDRMREICENCGWNYGNHYSAYCTVNGGGRFKPTGYYSKSKQLDEFRLDVLKSITKG